MCVLWLSTAILEFHIQKLSWGGVCGGGGGGGGVHDRNVPSDTAIAKAHMMLNSTGCFLGIKS